MLVFIEHAFFSYFFVDSISREIYI